MKSAYMFSNLLECGGLEEALEVHGGQIAMFLLARPEVLKTEKTAAIVMFEDESIVIIDPVSMAYSIATDEDATAIFVHLIQNREYVSKVDVSKILEVLRNVTQKRTIESPLT